MNAKKIDLPPITNLNFCLMSRAAPRSFYQSLLKMLLIEKVEEEFHSAK